MRCSCKNCSPYPSLSLLSDAIRVVIKPASYIRPLLALMFGIAITINVNASCTGSSPTWNSTADQASVTTCISNASSGDTINVAAGSATWSITITKAIHLQGSGIGNTVINGGIDYSPTAAEASKVFEVNGFTFQGGAAGNPNFQPNAPDAAHPVTGLKVHDNLFRNCSAASCRSIILPGLSAGVFYNNTFSNNMISVSSLFASYWNNVQWDFTFSNGNNVYFEDNTFQNGAAGGWTSENGQSGRIAFRHNTITQTCSQCEVFDMHGEQGSGGWTLSSEIYHNTITAGGNRVCFHRGGQGAIFNNTIDSGALEFTEYYAWGGNGVCNPYPTAFNSAESYCSPINGTTCVKEQVRNTFYFNNKVGGTPTDFQWFNTTNSCGGTPSSYIQLNREYWQPTSGLESALPATCTANGNTYYGTTDTDKIYKCTSTNTWTLFFQPYTYPHPLRTGLGAGSPPTRPTNLTAVVQ